MMHARRGLLRTPCTWEEAKCPLSLPAPVEGERRMMHRASLCGEAYLVPWIRMVRHMSSVEYCRGLDSHEGGVFEIEIGASLMLNRCIFCSVVSLFVALLCPNHQSPCHRICHVRGTVCPSRTSVQHWPKVNGVARGRRELPMFPPVRANHLTRSHSCVNQHSAKRLETKETRTNRWLQSRND